ncbi:hypothetical protein BS614_11685 [Paenibacillus xylanexedens]|uniref:hypothetical protein n=1 Tax=Paenibacillus xylanexedens TaxID=528191 RepID=UPI0009384165|nr:hypothetical protein [Paenibacillus xylanexedens]APO44592.1 hypothetical protein BS614_11685 [Paenibacillus xylanexedens]
MMLIEKFPRNVRLTIGPYEQCPCGSKKSFKFCCKPKSTEHKHNWKEYRKHPDKRKKYEYVKNWNDTAFEICLAFDHEECRGNIKNAHSIQKKRILNRISRDGHLYQFIPDHVGDIVLAKFDRVSINKASTFQGFCDFHDNKLFLPIEASDYCNEARQNFLFSFRPLALECHNKIRDLTFRMNIFSERPDLTINEAMVYDYRTAQLNEREFKKEYEVFKKDYSEKNFNNIRTFYLKLDFEVNFATSGAFSVEFDMNGQQINENQMLSEIQEIKLIYLTIYPLENSTNIILSYHLRNDKSYNRLFEQLENASQTQILKYLNKIVINGTENIYFSQNFIENLKEAEKDSLLISFQASLKPLLAKKLYEENNDYRFDLFTT